MESIHIIILLTNLAVLSLTYDSKKTQLNDVYIATAEMSVYQYPWGNWEQELLIRNKSEATLKQYSIWYTSLIIFGAIVEVLRHIFDQNRKPYQPIFDGWTTFSENTILSLTIISIFHFFIVLSFITAVCALGIIIMNITERLMIEFDILKSVMRRPQSFINENFGVKEVIHCGIQHQCQIDRYFTIYQDSLKGLLLTAFIIQILMICTLGFVMVNTDSMIEKASLCSVLAPELFTALVICWYGQRICDSIDDLNFTIYDMDWYNFKPPLRKTIVTIMTRNQKCLELTAARIKTLNLATYSEVLSEAYTYLNVLQAIKLP